MQHEGFLVGPRQRVDELLVLAGAERGDDDGLGFTAREHGRTVGARQDTDFRDDRTDRREVAAVDVNGFLAGSAASDDALEVQYDSGAGWIRIGPAQNLRTTARSRRLAVAPSIGTVLAQNLRVVVAGGAGAGRSCTGTS